MKFSAIFSVVVLIPLFGLIAAPGIMKHNNYSLGYKDTLIMSYLALGDSYTIGESVTAAERFPAQAAAFLLSQDIRIADLQFIARTGWTSADLLDAISRKRIAQTYDLVTLLIGVNDQYRGLDTGGYRIRFIQLLQNAIRLAGNQPAHVFVLSIPDYGVTPFGGGSSTISKEIHEFNAINRQVTIANRVGYIDITPESREAGNDPSLLANDGLHPSGKQYRQWALQLVAAIVAGRK